MNEDFSSLNKVFESNFEINKVNVIPNSTIIIMQIVDIKGENFKEKLVAINNDDMEIKKGKRPITWHKAVS